MASKRFPEGFLWGTSTSSFQVEMGEGEPASSSDWWVWVHDAENIRRGNASGAFPENGPGFWSYYREDLKAAKEDLGNNSIRLSIDWSRIFPKSTSDIEVNTKKDEYDDVFEVDINNQTMRALKERADPNSVRHYREIFQAANELGLKIFLTLYHWPLPIWLHDPIICRDNITEATTRGWLDQRTIIEYTKYSAFVAATFGDLVDIYATINEAPIISKYGYLHEKVHFPPGINNIDLFLTVFKNLAIAHGLGYEQVKQWDKSSMTGKEPAEVGVVSVLEQYDPLDEANPEDRRTAEFNRYLWNEWNLNAVITGDFDLNLDGAIQESERRPQHAKGCDFIGVDYYLRERVMHKVKDGDPRFDYEFVAGTGKTSDTGWEIYPEGLGSVLRWAYNRYGKPMYVTENGVADSTDTLRVDYLRSHLEQVQKVTEEGVPVKGYYYWSLIDNYSWFSGYRSRFGLFNVDMGTKERRPTSGVKFYKEIATMNRLP